MFRSNTTTSRSSPSLPRPCSKTKTSRRLRRASTNPKVWFTFYNPAIGNGTNIGSNVPYVTVLGTGNGTWDQYTFQVTGDMLRRSGATYTGTLDTHTYYTSATIGLLGGVGKDDKWTVTIDGRDYHYTAGLTDGLSRSPRALCPSSTRTSGRCDLHDGARFRRRFPPIADPNGFSVALKQEVAAAGTVTRTLETVNPVQFNSATLVLSGTPKRGETWTVRIGTTPYAPPVIGTQTLDQVGDALAALIAGATYNSTTDTLSLSSLAGQTVAFSVSGNAPDGSALISGTPVQTQVPSINWDVALVTLTGAVHDGQEWTITLTRGATVNTYSTTATDTDDLAAITGRLRSAIVDGYTAVLSGGDIRISRTDLAAFRVGLSVTAAPVTSSMTVGGTPSHYSTAVVTLGGTPKEGETWRVTIKSNELLTRGLLRAES